ncbi:hypothetical protein FACS1894217_03420 [Clostridia bacterium]|nr:hypothetical protein FACS1894217_03420 [Clostridia bacterium]
MGLPMLKIVLGSLFKKPATVAFPAKPKINDELVRGQVAIELEKCIFCGICSKACPTRALSVDRAGKVWTIRRFECINCAFCVEKCPKKCLAMNNNVPPAATDRHVSEVQRAVNA